RPDTPPGARASGPPATPRGVVETSTPVLSERLSLPRSRAPVAISAVLLTVSAALAVAVLIYRWRLPPRDLSEKAPPGALSHFIPPIARPVSAAPVEATAHPAESAASNPESPEKKAPPVSLAAETAKPKRAARDAGPAAAPVVSSETRPVEPVP